MNKRIVNVSSFPAAPLSNHIKYVSRFYEKIISKNQRVASLTDTLVNRANVTQTLLLAMTDVQDLVINKRSELNAYQFAQWAGNSENFITIVNDVLNSNEEYFAIDLKLTIGQYNIPDGVRGLLRVYCSKVAYWIGTGQWDVYLLDDYIQMASPLIKVYNINTNVEENISFTELMKYLNNIIVTATTYYLVIDNFGSDPYSAIDRIVKELQDRFNIVEDIVNDSIGFVSNNVHQLYSLPNIKSVIQTLCDSTVSSLSEKGIINPSDLIGENSKPLLTLEEINFNYFTGNSLYAIMCTGLGLVPAFLSDVADAVTCAVFGLFVILGNVGNTILDFLSNLAESLYHSRDPIDCSISHPDSNNLTFDNASMGPPIIIDPSNEDYLKPTLCRSWICGLLDLPIDDFYPSNPNSENNRINLLHRLNSNFVRQYHSDEIFKTVTINVKEFEISGNSLFMIYYIQYRYKPIRGGLSELVKRGILIPNNEESGDGYIAYKFSNDLSPSRPLIELANELIDNNFLYNNDSAWNNKSQDTSDTAFFLGITQSIIFDHLLQSSFTFYGAPQPVVIYGNPSVSSDSPYHFYNNDTINRLTDYEANLFTNKEFYQLLSFDFDENTIEAKPNTAIYKYLVKRNFDYNGIDLFGILSYLIHNVFTRCIILPLYNVEDSEGLLMLLPSEQFLDLNHKFHINTDSENTTNSALALAQTWGLVAITACSILGAKLLLSANKRIFQKNLVAYQQLQQAALTGNTELTPATIKRINNTVFSKGAMPATIFNTSGTGNSEIVSNITETILSVIK